MDTKHIFNSMKMVFNHLAKAWGGTPIWFLHEYEGYDVASKTHPKQLAFLTVFFIIEIFRRGDLPEKYHEPFNEILAQLNRKLPEDWKSLLTNGVIE